MHLGSRSDSFTKSRETIPVQSLGASGRAKSSPSTVDAHSSLHLQDNNLGRMRAACLDMRSHKSLQKASLAQKQVESFPTTIGIAPTLKEKRSLFELPPPKHFAFEEQARQLPEHVPPPTQLMQLDLVQLRAEIAHLKEIVQELARQSFSKHKADDNNNNTNSNNNIDNNTTNNTNNNNNNNDKNNDTDNSTTSRESSFSSLDLDNDNPESDLSGSDLDESSLGSFNPKGLVESSVSSEDQQEAACSFDKHHLGTLGHQMLTIGFSLGSLTQNNQKGITAGTTWDPSLGMDRDSFDKKKQRKKVSFSEATLEAYKARSQNNRQQNSQLRQLEHNNEHTNHQQAWQSRPSMMQQQTATASEKKLEHRPCNHDNLDSEDGTLGSLEHDASTTTLRACRCPKLNNNNSSILGQDLKNKAAWGILVDTGAAVSLAPVSFAPETELSPLESTLQLRTVTGKEIKALGRKTVHFPGRELSFDISFVIADVEHALLGLDVLLREQLSMITGSNGEINLVNKAGAKTKLQQKGHLLYIEACSTELGLSTCRGSSLPQNDGSLLDDKNGTYQGAALQHELDHQEVSSSGGAFGSSFSLENLRQHKNTTSLGATALPTQGAKKRNKKRKPSAKRASHNQLDENSSKQEGQQHAAAQLRTLNKTSLIAEIELAAEEAQESFSKIDQQELSMRILLILSLSFKWQLVTTRATTACSEELLGEQLRSIGLDQNQLDQNIFSEDELVVMLCKSDLLIGGTEQQQETFFIELSAVNPLDQPTKLAHKTPISFGNKIVEWNEASNSISLSLPSAFYKELLQRHQLEDAEAITSLEPEKLCQDASGQNIALEAHQAELYKRTVGDLALAAACRPDLCFEVHLLTQSLTTPTREQEMQLHKELRYLKGTQHYTLSLHPTNQMTQERASSLNLVAFSASSWTEESQSTSTAYLTLWGAPVIASLRTTCAYNQANAELDSVQLALKLACSTKSLLQQLSVEQLAHQQVNISLRTSNWHDELVTGRPLAMQLGLSRKNKRIQLRASNGQLHLSKVIPDKNLAHSLANIASDSTRMLAKLRVLTEAAEIVALTTVRGQDLASFGFSSSLVGGVTAETPAMATHQLRQLDLAKSDYESFSRTCFERSSLTLPSLSFQKSDQESFRSCFERQSLTLHSLSLEEASLQSNSLESLTETSLSLSADNSDSLILPNCSLQSENTNSLTLQSLSFTSDSLEEIEKKIAHSLATGGAETNSFAQHSLQEEFGNLELEDELAYSEAGTNSFAYKSFLERIVSLQMRLGIFLLVSFQLICAALFLVTSYVTKSFQSFSAQLCKSNLDSLINQLDLRTSLSLNQFGSTAYRSQLQNKFQTAQLVHQQLSGNRALAPQLRTRTTSLMRTRALNDTSFKATSLRSRSRTSSFRNNQLHTVIFDHFICTSFLIQINLSQAQSSFQRNLALQPSASQSRSLRD